MNFLNDFFENCFHGYSLSIEIRLNKPHIEDVAAIQKMVTSSSNNTAKPRIMAVSKAVINSVGKVLFFIVFKLDY